MGKMENLTPCKIKNLEQKNNLSGLIMSTRGTFFPSLWEIRSQGPSGQTVKCKFFVTLFIYFYI